MPHESDPKIRRLPQELGETRFLASIERWISGKSQADLLAALKVYVKRLADNPHSIQDRLYVASIQYALKRKEEALVHYDAVLRDYLAQADVLSAIALCEHLLLFFSDSARLKRLLTALYAQAPRGRVPGARLATPIDSSEGPGFLLDVQDVRPNKEDVKVARVFDHNDPFGSMEEIEALLDRDDMKSNLIYEKARRSDGDFKKPPFALTKKKKP